jgi:hypothetical protein
MDTGSVLGLPAVRTSLLDDISAAEARRAEAGGRARIMSDHTSAKRLAYSLDDEDDEDIGDPDDDDDFDTDDDDDDDEDDEEDDDDVETWQVSRTATPFPLNLAFA